MGEAAAKEPSMEDILSSIRKIIAEEGAPETSATQEQNHVDDFEVRPPQAASEPTQEFQPVADEPVIAHTVDEAPVAEPVSSEPAPAQTDGAMSLASIAASLRSAPEPEATAHVEVEPVATAVVEEAVEAYHEPEVYEAPVAQEPQETVVEMAEATPPPQPVAQETAIAVSAPVAEDLVIEEEAFRGALMSPSVDGAVTGSFDRLKRSAMDDLDAKTEAILRPMLREWLDENLPSMVERLVREEIERVARG